MVHVYIVLYNIHSNNSSKIKHIILYGFIVKNRGTPGAVRNFWGPCLLNSDRGKLLNGFHHAALI